MKKVLIIGANGKIGKILAAKMKVSTEFQPIALVRKEAQRLQFDQQQIECRLGSLEGSTDDLETVMEDIDAIVFAAGSGGSTGDDKTLSVDLDGAVKVMESAKKLNIKRFIIISAIQADDRAFWEKSGIKGYYIAKHYADRVLKEIGLNYTIVRPGALLDEPGKGLITIDNPTVQRGVPREDVADVVLTSLQQDNTIGKVIEFNEGDKPIKEVLNAL